MGDLAGVVSKEYPGVVLLSSGLCSSVRDWLCESMGEKKPPWLDDACMRCWIKRERRGGREGGREGGRRGEGREGGREGGRRGEGREGGRKGGREEGRRKGGREGGSEGRREEGGREVNTVGTNKLQSKNLK